MAIKCPRKPQQDPVKRQSNMKQKVKMESRCESTIRTRFRIRGSLTGTSWWRSSWRRVIPGRRQNGSRHSCRWFPLSHRRAHFGLNQSSPHHSHLKKKKRGWMWVSFDIIGIWSFCTDLLKQYVTHKQNMCPSGDHFRWWHLPTYNHFTSSRGQCQPTFNSTSPLLLLHCVILTS